MDEGPARDRANFTFWPMALIKSPMISAKASNVPLVNSAFLSLPTCGAVSLARASKVRWMLGQVRSGNACGWVVRRRPPDAGRKRLEVLHDCGKLELIACAR